MIYLSASSIKDFLQCSMKYYYRIFEKEVQVQTQPMAIGSSVHDIIEKYWNNEEEAFATIDSSCEVFGVEQKNSSLVTEFVENYFKYFKSLMTEDDSIEESFKVQYRKGVYIVGKFDRVIRGETLVDWKTSKRTPYDLSNDVQFMLYDWAYKRIYDKDPAGVLYASLKSGKLVSFKENNLYTDILFREVIPDMIMRISKGYYTKEGKLKPFSPCNYCTYKEHCLRSKDE